MKSFEQRIHAICDKYPCCNPVEAAPKEDHFDQLLQAVFGDVPEPCLDPGCPHCHPDGRVTIDLKPAQVAALDNLEFAELITKVIQ